MGRTATWSEYIPLTNGGSANATKAIHPECIYAVVNVADNSTTVSAIPALLFGVYVNTALSAHVLKLQDNTTAALAVADATEANPIQVTTSVPHGLVSGNTVDFAAMPGDFGTNLNGNNYVITYVSTTEFTVPVDGSLYGAYTSGGTVVGATTVVTIPASAVAGAMYPMPGFRFETSLVVNPLDAATGSVAIAYRPI